MHHFDLTVLQHDSGYHWGSPRDLLVSWLARLMELHLLKGSLGVRKVFYSEVGWTLIAEQTFSYV